MLRAWSWKRLCDNGEKIDALVGIYIILIIMQIELFVFHYEDKNKVTKK